MCDAPDIFHQEEIVARRPHWCCECNGRIGIGQKYERIKGLWDGRWDTYSTCLACTNVRAVIQSQMDTFDCLGVGAMRDFWDIILEVPREMLSHTMLQEVQDHTDSRFWDNLNDTHDNYIKFRRTHGYSSYNLIKPLMDWYAIICSPKKFKKWQEENIKDLRKIQQSFNYYLEHKDSPLEWQREHCRKKLEHPQC